MGLARRSGIAVCPVAHGIFDPLAGDPLGSLARQQGLVFRLFQNPLGIRADLVADGGKGFRFALSGVLHGRHNQSAGIGDKIVYVPYDRGRAPAELLGSRIDAALQFPGQFVSHAEAGTLKILAVTSDERIKLLPDVPTAKEEGVDMNITMWRGLAAPKGTPPEVVKSLEEAAQKASESKEFIDASEKIGFTPAYLPSEKFGELIASDDKKISKLMDDLGLKK